MKLSRILIIGGYGNTGLNIARLLLAHTDVHIIIAGRNEEKARETALQLEKKFLVRVDALHLDLSKQKALEQVFHECDLVINASATVEWVDPTIKLAIKAGVDYLDTQLSCPKKIEELKKYKRDYIERDMTVITDGGFHPGIPAALIRYAGLKFDELIKANVYSFIGINWKEIQTSSNTKVDFANEMKEFNPKVFRNKAWEKIPFRKMGNFQYDFGNPIGKRNCAPMYLHELQALPERYPQLEETGFYVSGFNWFADNIATPLVMMAMKIKSNRVARLIGKFFFWSLGAFARPPFITLLRLEAHGIKNEKEYYMQIALSHEDAYVLTAAPVVACVKQYLQKEHRPGFYYQSHFVEPKAFLKNMENLGVNVLWSKVHKANQDKNILA